MRDAHVGRDIVDRPSARARPPKEGGAGARSRDHRNGRRNIGRTAEGEHVYARLT